MKKNIIKTLLLFLTVFSVFGQSIIGCWYINDANGWSRWAKTEYAITDNEFKLRDHKTKKQTIYSYKIKNNTINLKEKNPYKNGFPKMNELSFSYEIENNNYMTFHYKSGDIKLVNGKYINEIRDKTLTAGVATLGSGVFFYGGGTLVDYLDKKSGIEKYANAKMLPNTEYTDDETGGKNLSKNMCNFLGLEKQPENTQAAHIIAKKDSRFKSCRDIAYQVGIDLNHAANGVFLPDNAKMANKFGTFIHCNANSETHSNEFANELTTRISYGVRKYMDNDGRIKPDKIKEAKNVVIGVLNEAREACLTGGW